MEYLKTIGRVPYVPTYLLVGKFVWPRHSYITQSKTNEWYLVYHFRVLDALPSPVFSSILLPPPKKKKKEKEGGNITNFKTRRGCKISVLLPREQPEVALYALFCVPTDKAG